MTGIVVVSHSPALARAAVDLAMEMVRGEGPPIEIAAGTADGSTGTDAAAISAAIETVTSGEDAPGAVVLCDIGSAVVSAQMALEFLDPQVAERVILSHAPLVEGLIGAVVTASAGADAQAVAAEAGRAVDAKRAQIAS
ncbi:dihydroxyacetone kinase [Helcobacillus sp. ACRRO]|uniref:dihydroxyacetone kinase phosphoryl donor subunit DhaM n=1 Tax=Helcobacillus sp. ACRRO TaxID=2918202 RepID=UPI001EF3FD7C|nr:dihydroxyacetone kinase phosphoryl donor subunit DhaM [Helcobacillus sp. ACRRO]MCG7426970.1 dihydroxyacetone kinase [Helcobacillus sp. ACRRO]